MGGDSGSISFTKQLMQNKKRVRQLIVAASSLFALILFFKACSSNNNNSNRNGPFLQQKRGESPFFAAPPPTPNIVWLMTLSNAGSSFVLSLISRATDFSMATNYGQDVTPPDQYSISINPRQDCGPYWAGLGDTSSTTRRKLPTNNVLVQTYCQTKTTPLVPTLEEYLQDCVTTFGRTAPDPSTLTQHAYEPSQVTKAIQLVRNPFTQIITKFQKEYKSHVVTDQSWKRDYPPTREGFQKWCRAADEKTTELNDEYYSASTVQLMSETKCSRYIAEYISWHNHAFDTTASLSIPHLVVYHQDLYDDSLEATLDTMLDFLQLKQQTMPSQRLGDSDKLNVNDFLSRDDQKQIRRLVQKLATDETWSHVQRYFQDVM